MVTYRGKAKVEIQVEIDLEKSDDKAAKRIMENLRVRLEEGLYGDHVKLEICRIVPFSATTLLIT